MAAAESDEAYRDAAAVFLEADRSFHRALVERAGNSRLTTMVEGLWAQIAVFQKAGTFRRTTTDSSIHYHRRIIAALVDGDDAAAVLQLKEHIEDVKVRALEDLAAMEDAVDASRKRDAKDGAA